MTITKTNSLPMNNDGKIVGYNGYFTWGDGDYAMKE